MIYLFHGEDQVSLRGAFLSLKERYGEVSYIPDVPRTAPSPTSLFGEKMLFVSENPKELGLKNLPKILSRFAKDSDLAIYFSRTLAPKDELFNLLKNYPARIFYFAKRPSEKIFPFLDALAQRDLKRSLWYLNSFLKKGEDPNFIFSMIYWQVRNLLLVRSGTTKNIHPYVLGKLKLSTKNFSEQDLKEIYGEILKKDLDLKRGRGSFSLGFLVRSICRPPAKAYRGPQS